MDANEQKQQSAKQSSILYSQHHQVHLVCHHSNSTTHRDASAPQTTPCPILFPVCASHCLPLLSAEAREDERGGAEEEAVGGPGAREDSEQIKILQRGQDLSLSLLYLQTPRNISFTYRLVPEFCSQNYLTPSFRNYLLLVLTEFTVGLIALDKVSYPTVHAKCLDII